MRACARIRAGAAIFVHLGAEGALKMFVRVRAYNTLVRTCGDVRHTSARPFFIFFTINQYKFSKKKKIIICKIFIFLFRLVGSGVRPGAKTGVRVCAPQTIKMCAICVRVRPKICAH